MATYTYDPFGRRVKKDVAGNVTYFLYSSEGLLAEYDASGNVQVRYGWSPKGVWGTNPLVQQQGGAITYYHTDHLGTPQKLTDATGAVVWTVTYSAFGEANVDPALTVTNNLRFPGHYFDEETRLHDNYFRQYDPSVGRYVQTDPMGLDGGINGYAYAGLNPCIRSDRYGLWSTADAALVQHFYSGKAGYVDISKWCADYLADPQVQMRTTLLKHKIDSEARKLSGSKGESTILINDGKALYVTGIYSFGAGNVHRQSAECTLKGDGCCVSARCTLRYYAVDRFDDPLDLCQRYGICGSIRNVGGTPFWFGLSCVGSYSSRNCK